MEATRTLIKGNINSKIKADAQKLAKELNIPLYEFMEDALKRHIKKISKNIPKAKRAKTEKLENIVLNIFKQTRR
jgi:diaminopimelate decarboxylase